MLEVVNMAAQLFDCCTVAGAKDVAFVVVRKKPCSAIHALPFALKLWSVNSKFNSAMF